LAISAGYLEIGRRTTTASCRAKSGMVSSDFEVHAWAVYLFTGSVVVTEQI
jgi:hypothetical protein